MNSTLFVSFSYRSTGTGNCSGITIRMRDVLEYEHIKNAACRTSIGAGVRACNKRCVARPGRGTEDPTLTEQNRAGHTHTLTISYQLAATATRHHTAH